MLRESSKPTNIRRVIRLVIFSQFLPSFNICLHTAEFRSFVLDFYTIVHWGLYLLLWKLLQSDLWFTMINFESLRLLWCSMNYSIVWADCRGICFANLNLGCLHTVDFGKTVKEW